MGAVSALGLSILLLASSLAVEIAPTRESLEVHLALESDLPQAFEDALPTGAVIRVTYPLRVRVKRTLFWDRRLWHGEVSASAAFDPITGRYRCELLLDEVMVASEERESAERAAQWLTRPPPVRLALRDVKRLERVYVKARAVFSTSTTWLVFPDVEGTDWVESYVTLPSDPEAAPSASPAPSPAPSDDGTTDR